MELFWLLPEPKLLSYFCVCIHQKESHFNISKNTLGRAIILALGGSAKIMALPSVFLDILK